MNASRPDAAKRVVVVLSSTPTFGGGFAYSEAIVRGLAAHQGPMLKVHALCLNPRWGDFSASLGLETSVGRDMPVWIRKLRRGLLLAGLIPVWRRLRRWLSPLHRQLAELQPDLVLFPCEQHWSVDSPAPAVAPIHDLMYHYESRFPEVGTPAVRHARYMLDRAVVRECTVVLVDSPTGARHVAEVFKAPAGKTRVLPYVTVRMSAAADAVLPTGLPTRYVFYPAQYWRHKNHVGLLEALALLKQRGLRVDAVFCGSAKNSGNEVQEAIARLGLQDQVTVLGFVDNETLSALYARATALVMPTFFGPTNIPPLEAIALGCPVAVSGIYGMREQLGKAAVYFDPAAPADIAVAIERLWTDTSLRDSLIGRGRELVRQWNLAVFGQHLVAIIGEVPSK